MTTRHLRWFFKRLSLDENGCWIWTGAKRNRAGYGGLELQYRKLQAHRVSYSLFKGHIPAGLHIDHLCRVPACVNPAHLEAVTVRENTLRGIGTPAVNAAKTHCIHGHLFSGDNLYISKRGWRVCNECSRRHNREAYRRRAA